MTSAIRAGVLVGAMAMSATAVSVAEPPDNAVLPASGGAMTPLAPLHQLAARGDETAERAGIARLRPRLAAAIAGRAIAERPRHPVRGPADYGEAGARFGAGRSGHVHEGQDVFAPAGTPLVAVGDAIVVEAGDDGGRGNYVALYDQSANLTYVYLHMQEPTRVRTGSRVRAGALVGAVGCTGSCSGDHLHFEVRRGRGTEGAAIDPLPQLLRWARPAELRSARSR